MSFTRYKNLPDELQLYVREKMPLADRESMLYTARAERTFDPNFQRDLKSSIKQKVDDYLSSIRQGNLYKLDGPKSLHQFTLEQGNSIGFLSYLAEQLYQALKQNYVNDPDSQYSHDEQGYIGSQMVSYIVDVMNGIAESEKNKSTKSLNTVFNYIVNRIGGVEGIDETFTDFEKVFENVVLPEVEEYILDNLDVSDELSMYSDRSGEAKSPDEDDEGRMGEIVQHVSNNYDQPLYTYEQMRQVLAEKFGGRKKRKTRKSKRKSRKSRKSKRKSRKSNSRRTHH